MSKGFFSSARSYLKNVFFHLREVTSGTEAPKDALVRLGTDTRKLGRALVTPGEEGRDRKRAVALVKSGRAKYNAGQYAAAEAQFRDAVAEDPACALGCTYLGHALYQQGKLGEAMAAWKRAYSLEPASHAGLKAMKKLRHVARAHGEVLQNLEERTQR